MKRAVSSIICSALLALVSGSAANAAAPIVEGKYAFLSTEVCEAQLTLKKDSNGKVTDVQLSRSGLLAANVGYITFTPSTPGATSGTAVITGSTLVEGGALRIGNNGFNWDQHSDNQTAQPYSFTGTTFTYADQTYKLVFSDSEGSGSYRNVYLLRRTSNDNNPTNPDCLQAISASKQPASP